MMGPRQRREPKLFYTGVNLDDRIGADHPLRQVIQLTDFTFVRSQVEHLYGRRGNPSVDPVVLLKLMFLLYYENVASERRLMEQLPLRLDWLWFCGYDLDDTIPDHSVISKARRRWGTDVFQTFFAQVLSQCIEGGLVDGQVVHVDASLIEANADTQRLRPALRLTGQELYEQLDRHTSPIQDDGRQRPAPDPLPSAPISPSDPDARLTRSHGKSVLGYKDHRVVDDQCGIITATATTDAATSEAQILSQVLDQHGFHVGQAARTVVADKAYGTAENYQALHGRGVLPCVPHETYPDRPGKFPRRDFHYDASGDCFVCPAGQVLKRWNREPKRRRTRYRTARGVCPSCPLKSQCTDSRSARLLSRYDLQAYIDWADGCWSRGMRRWLMRRRKIRAEGSFADAANNHGYKRARWRGLWKMHIQNVLIATIQNLRKLLRKGRFGKPGAAEAVLSALFTRIQCLFRVLKTFWPQKIPPRATLWKTSSSAIYFRVFA